MTLPDADTVVLHPDGALTAEARVLHVAPLPGGRLGVLLDRTPFHPVDPVWPDQGPDRGVLRWGGAEVRVEDAVVGGTDGERLFVGEDLPVRPGTAGWHFVVVHVVPADAALAEGETVEARVDAEHRRALSAGHTVCHLASLALDAALADAWSKDVAVDPLGAPAFDRLAIERSRIRPDGSEDRYRIGKSLRKKGFDPAALDDLAALAAAVGRELARWLASGAAVRIERAEPGLSGRRTWVCALPEGEARIPCGGTHVDSLAALGPVRVALAVEPADGALTMTMTTTVARS